MSRYARRRLVPVMVLLLAGGAACADAPDDAEEGSEVATASHSPSELGVIGARVYMDPDGADAILENAGLDRQALAARIREISTDPEASAAYTEAFRSEAGEAGDAAGDTLGGGDGATG